MMAPRPHIIGLPGQQGDESTLVSLVSLGEV